MTAEIIACGTELLLGHGINTNASYISNSLSRIGLDVFRHVTVGDNKERFSSAIKEALARSNIVIITGGLGPTVDDITMGTLASVIKKDLVFNKSIYKYIKESFKKSAFKVPKDAIKQALIPRGADWMENKVGTAPGLIIKHEKKYLIALPGPPRELIPMFEKDVMPLLGKVQPQKWTIKSKSLRLIGLPEAKVNEKVKDLLELGGHTTLGIYARLGQVELKITSKAHNENIADSNIKRLEGKIRERLKTIIYGVDNETLQEAAGNILAKKKKTLALAESCTGGLISNLITDVPGSSRYFTAGIIAYSDKIKIKRLDMSKELIKKYGAVSKEVAKSMADNIRALADTDIGIGVTGIAGPTGRTKKKPIGLVYIALSSKKKKIVKEFIFSGKREEIKLQAAYQALNLLRLNI